MSCSAFERRLATCTTKPGWKFKISPCIFSLNVKIMAEYNETEDLFSNERLPFHQYNHFNTRVSGWTLWSQVLFFLLLLFPIFRKNKSVGLAIDLLRWTLAYILHSLCQDQYTVAQRAETTAAECSLTSCVWARFRIGSHTTPGQKHSQPTPTSLGQGCMRVQV